MPILDMTLTTPLTAALTKFLHGVLVVDARAACPGGSCRRASRSEIRIDGAAAVADEQREMMHFARFAGFEHQADSRAACLRGSGDDAAPATASNAGMGALSLSTPRSDRIDDVRAVRDGVVRLRRTDCPCAVSNPFAPSAALNRMGSVTDLNPGRSTCRSFCKFFVGENRAT